ncbi:MAG: hypothetical protein LBK29_00955 [Oscillospiraceae bacterium]|jgi:chromosome segregation ATPase|nr:hypothetical protein [Oscillospiraceae bacterium]
MKKLMAIFLAMCFLTSFCNGQEIKLEKVNGNSLYLAPGLTFGVLLAVAIFASKQKQVKESELLLAELHQSLQTKREVAHSVRVRELQFRIAELISIDELLRNLELKNVEIQRLNSDIEGFRKSLAQSNELRKLKAELDQCQAEKGRSEADVKRLKDDIERLTLQDETKQSEIAQLQKQMLAMSEAIWDHMRYTQGQTEIRIKKLNDIHEQEKKSLEKQIEDFKELIEEILKYEGGAEFLQEIRGSIEEESEKFSEVMDGLLPK